MALELNGTTGVSLVQDGVITDANLPAGSVLQVVQGTPKTDTFTTQSQSFVDVTGLSLSITPQSASSKILIMFNINVGADQHTDIRLVRNSTDIAIGDSDGVRVRSTVHTYRGNWTGGVYDIVPMSMTWLDSPSTTSATTYKIQIANPNSAAYTSSINRADSDDNAGYNARTVSTITAMEIAG